MDHTNAPDYLWYEALQYVSTLHNHIGLQLKKHVVLATPDISKLLQYLFYEPIYNIDAETILCHSREVPGTFLGLATNIGDALT